MLLGILLFEGDISLILNIKYTLRIRILCPVSDTGNLVAGQRSNVPSRDR